MGRGFGALRHRNFRLYWSGQVVSLVGTWMQSVSQPWLVLELGGSALQVGTVIALQFAPALFLAPIGGVLADRFDKRGLLLVTQALAMLQAATLFGLTFSGGIEIWQIQVLALILGITSAFDMPVRQSFVAEVVPRRDLLQAIALNSASFNLARVVGPAVAGITLALFGSAFNFGINTLTYTAVLVGLLLIDPKTLIRVPIPAIQPSIRTSLREGFQYAAQTPSVLWLLVLLGGMSVFAMNFQTLLPLFARFTLDMDAGAYGALFAVMGAGSLVGSLVLAFMGESRPRLRLILGGGVAFLVFEVMLGLIRTPALAYPVVALVGLASMLMVNTINATVQRSVPDELRGRVMALYVTVFAGSGPLGGLFAGAVAQVLGPPAGFIIGAALASIFLALTWWKLGRRGPMPLTAPTPA
ncbi:MAG TPA: MFS transporter [Candidatus Limnocylindria bacterium]|jgi:MFS family permease|nr:MFS transporter [Candidatus Limnocylindria bacterium]